MSFLYINLYITVEVLYYKEPILLSPFYLLINGKRVPILGCIKIELMLISYTIYFVKSYKIKSIQQTNMYKIKKSRLTMLATLRQRNRRNDLE